ncbi:MAG: hypothetical protein LAT82_03305 [Nanoarchaeota archaeon]|nr:hypothetical protein [Nanoarchaeota archaeon]
MVTISVNKQRRENLQKLHTATHLLNYAAKEVLGNHIWQHGSNLKEEIGSLDITHYKQLTQEEIFQIEKKVQKLIIKAQDVFIEELERTTAEQKYGFRLYQGGAIPQRVLRIVHVGEYDIEACGGLHVGNSKDIGLFKIVSTSKLQDGVIRVEYKVSEFAYEFIQDQQRELQHTAKEFTVDWKSTSTTAAKFFKEWKEQKKTIEQFEKSILELHTLQIKQLEIKECNDEYELKESLSMKVIQELFEIGRKSHTVFTLITPQVILSTQDSITHKFKKQIKRGEFYQYII